MGKKVAIIVLALGLFAAQGYAQDTTKGFVHKGLLRAAATFSTGIMTSVNITNVYLTGNLEYYADSKISVRGDVYYFFNSLNNVKTLKANDQLYFGASYNIPTQSHFNPFVGIQPGIAYSQVNSLYEPPPQGSISPLASVITGFNFYGEKWFHILVNVRYCVGRHTDDEGLFDLNELSFSFGLGFNLDVIKRK